VGICISWAGFLCQSLVTATSYTVVGVMNKMLTVTVNVLIWDKHASSRGIFSLALCLIGGSLYQQAPDASRPTPRPPLPPLADPPPRPLQAPPRDVPSSPEGEYLQKSSLSQDGSPESEEELEPSGPAGSSLARMPSSLQR
jgi:hypothetical protein